MSVIKRGSKYWIYFRHNHERYRKSSPENTYAGAKAYEALIRQKIARGEDVYSSIKKPEKTQSFLEFSSKWLELYVKTNNKYSEAQNKESILKVHLQPFFGIKPLDKINGLDIENFKAEKIAMGLANKTINNFLIVFSRCLKIAQEWGVIQDIPRIKLLKVQAQKFDFLSLEECQILLGSAKGLIRDMIFVALRTGLRFGELIALEWSDIDFNGRQITVRQSFSRGKLGSTKSNKIRYVPMLEEVYQILQARSKKDTFVFSQDNGSPCNPMLCLRYLHKSCRESGLRKIGWHTFRHTFASHLTQIGVSVNVVKELLGHSDIRTTMRYSHLNSSVIREAVYLLGKNNGHNMATISETGSNFLAFPVSVVSQKTLKT